MILNSVLFNKLHPTNTMEMGDNKRPLKLKKVLDESFLWLFVACFAAYRKEEFYTVWLKTYNVIVFINFQHTKL